MSSREAARATSSTVAARAGAGIFTGSPSSSGNFGKSSLDSVRRWKLELPLRISTSPSLSRSSIVTEESPRERASSATRRPGRRAEPARSTSATSFVFRPISRSVARRSTPFSSALSRIPASAGVAARVETARETTESLATSSSRLVVSFK
jgi:hypothetical protein